MASEGGGMCVDGQTHRIRMKYSQIAYHTRLHAFLLDQSCLYCFERTIFWLLYPHFLFLFHPHTSPSLDFKLIVSFDVEIIKKRDLL